MLTDECWIKLKLRGIMLGTDICNKPNHLTIYQFLKTTENFGSGDYFVSIFLNIAAYGKHRSDTTVNFSGISVLFVTLLFFCFFLGNSPVLLDHYICQTK